MTSGGKLAIYSVVVANSAFANLFVQNAWPAVLYIAFSWHVYYVAIINTFLYFNIIPPTTTVSSQKKKNRDATSQFFFGCYLMLALRAGPQMPTSPAVDSWSLIAVGPVLLAMLTEHFKRALLHLASLKL